MPKAAAKGQRAFLHHALDPGLRQGPYERIGEAYNAVMTWLEPNGYHIAGPVREVYLRGPGDTENPEEYVTEIQVPVEKA